MALKPQVELRCGCAMNYREGVFVCPQHGPQAVARVLNLPPPRIRGVCTGPHVTPEDLAPFSGRIVGTEPAKES